MGLQWQGLILCISDIDVLSTHGKMSPHNWTCTPGIDGPCAAWPVQFACFQNKRRCNKHLSFCLTAPFCTAGGFPVLHCQALCFPSSAQLLCTYRSYYNLHTGFPPTVDRRRISCPAALCCLRPETRRKTPQVSGVWPKIVPPYGCKDINCSRVSGLMLPILYM